VLFLLDENVPLSLGNVLARRGHDVALLPSSLRGATDRSVLAHAARTNRVLITLDTDFGTLVFVRRRHPPPAIVLLRLAAVELVARAETVTDAVEAALVEIGLFIVVDRQGVRVRPLPRP
jgi:predicted nuclease of predicted toxin-antitoxin system